MSSSDSIQTKDDFKKMFGRSPIKKGEQLMIDNDELDDEDTQFSNQLHKEDNVNYYNSLYTNSKKRLLFNDYSKLLEKSDLRDKLGEIPLKSLTKPVIKNDNRGGCKRTRVFRKKSTKRRIHKSSRRNSRKYK